MIEEILPAGVRSSEAFDDLTPAPLFPQEAALMAGRRPGRVRQFATARACARRSLSALGVAAGPLPTGAGGAPLWPAGVVGSITHCAGYRGAVAAYARDVGALGIDAEPALPLPDGVLGLVASAAERHVLRGLPRAGTPWDRLLFCAKEAVYKAWYPSTGRWLGFRDGTVSLAPDGTFTARVAPPDGLPPALAAEFSGRWLVRDGLLLTAVCAPPGPG